MRCILGIGNPGREYDGTRHNLGFAAVDELARRHGMTAWHKRWNAACGELPVPPAFGGGKALLIKPHSFVNRSGEVAQAVLAFYKIPPAELLVVVDDINLPLGALRLRPDGSAGGHNGLRSIEAALGQQYPRLRLGLGRPGPAIDQVGYVLGKFAPEEQADATAMLVKAADCIESWLREGVAVACRFNGPLRPEKPPEKPEKKAEE